MIECVVGAYVMAAPRSVRRETEDLATALDQTCAGSYRSHHDRRHPREESGGEKNRSTRSSSLPAMQATTTARAYAARVVGVSFWGFLFSFSLGGWGLSGEEWAPRRCASSRVGAAGGHRRKWRGTYETDYLQEGITCGAYAQRDPAWEKNAPSPKKNPPPPPKKKHKPPKTPNKKKNKKKTKKKPQKKKKHKKKKKKKKKTPKKTKTQQKNPPPPPQHPNHKKKKTPPPPPQNLTKK